MTPLLVDAFDKLRAGIQGQCPPERLHSDLRELLSLCKPFIIGAPRSDQVEILLEIGFLLGELPGNQQIWFWLRALAKEADAQLKDALTVTIFELVPDDPVDPTAILEVRGGK